MSISKRENEIRAFSNLKLRYQMILVWLPVVFSALFMGVAGYYCGVELAGFFSVDPAAPIINQPNSGKFFFLLMALFIFLFLFGFVVWYFFLICTFKYLAAFNVSTIKNIVFGRDYPNHWSS
ncbi:hypothetical protein HQ393_10430 [Chitinibacter bivalviorum]|uniref:Uncharacterized protein n=1 Tax=Chitinibacter bivalviorum TaxID=2739434 RepID=A0A7H9BJ00_9NEIS|nr:hypothetical protein [Chitinibacter bivalviorum]QLG88620.1 hypothetical protein HQ393_10430 [Chitinibacter bivalviorum]